MKKYLCLATSLLIMGATVFTTTIHGSDDKLSEPLVELYEEAPIFANPKFEKDLKPFILLAKTYEKAESLSETHSTELKKLKKTQNDKSNELASLQEKESKLLLELEELKSKLQEAQDKEAEQKNSVNQEAAPQTPARNQQATEKLYSLSDFMFQGRIFWGGYEWTYYSQQVLPGGGLVIPGRHVNADGYVADEDGYIVLAAPSSWGNVMHQVFETPFGYKGKVYDVNAGGTALDAYIQ